MACGRMLGRLTFLLARERRYIAGINIKLCFPELDDDEQAALVKQSFRENAIGLIETATGWVRPPSHFRHQVKLVGTEYLDAALAEGRGVLLLGAHYSTLDFGANLLSLHYPFAVTYRAHNNPLFDAFMLRGRLRNCNGVFDRKDIRGAFRHLKQGRILWYAPDQDYGPEQSVFAPFFGHRAATITAASRFATFNDSPVVLVRQGRLSAQKIYELEFMQLNGAFPSGDDTQDATLINATLERAIRVHPAQYLWMHKRFKTQPGGKPQSPYIQIKTPYKKLSEQQYAGLLSGSTRLFHGAQQTDMTRLQSGLVLREFAGCPGRLTRHRHAALRFDQLSKQLRDCGIDTATTDNIFQVASRDLTAVTCFLPKGQAFADRPVSVATAAEFLAQLHNNGFHFERVDLSRLLATSSAIAIPDPLQVRKVPGSAAWHQRLEDLRHWCGNTSCSTTQQDLMTCYFDHLRSNDAAGMRELLARHPDLLLNAPAPSVVGGAPVRDKVAS